jgi:hypothetical protein
MPQGSDENPKVFDVSKPHKITPSSSSRPIIVGHHPIMADPMVLEERYRHPKPLSPQPDEQPAVQAPSPVASGSIPQRTSISPPSDNQTSGEPSVEKAYTTYGAPQQSPEQPAEQPSVEHQQTSLAPTFESEIPGATSQKPDIGLPVMPQQPIPESPLHVPAGAASQEHARNQIGLAVILLVVIALIALLAVKYFVK